MDNRTDADAKFIDVDLDQWRRDINTFAAATTSALDGIVNELSNACSGGERPGIQASRAPAPTKRPVVAKQSKVESVAKRPPKVAPANTSPATTDGSSRLASLKEKLASRMNKG